MQNLASFVLFNKFDAGSIFQIKLNNKFSRYNFESVSLLLLSTPTQYCVTSYQNLSQIWKQAFFDNSGLIPY